MCVCDVLLYKQSLSWLDVKRFRHRCQITFYQFRNGAGPSVWLIHS